MSRDWNENNSEEDVPLSGSKGTPAGQTPGSGAPWRDPSYLKLACKHMVLSWKKSRQVCKTADHKYVIRKIPALEPSARDAGRQLIQAFKDQRLTRSARMFDQGANSGTEAIQVFEFVEGPCLFRCHSWFPTGYDGRLAQKLSAAMLLSIAELHRAGFSHGDVKVDNFTVCEESRPWPFLKLVDMDTCAYKSDLPHMKEWVLGTDYYNPPERYLGQQRQVGDVWALGTCVFVVHEMRFPWDGNLYEYMAKRKLNYVGAEALDKIIQWLQNVRTTVELPDKWDPRQRDFVFRCWDPNPDTRWTSEEALSHPWLAETVKELSKEVTKDTPPNPVFPVSCYNSQSRCRACKCDQKRQRE